MSNKDTNPLEEFEKLPGAFGRIVLTSGILIILTFSWSLFFRWPLSESEITGPLRTEEIRRYLFLSYLCIFAAVWVVYFLSRSQIRFFQVKTLRNLLAKTSEHWEERLNEKDQKEFVDAHHRKAQSSMVTVAIMIAACLIVLGEIHCIFLKHPSINDAWTEAILAIATIAAMLSLICFIISVDALDSIFNKFKNSKIAGTLKHYFYLKTINPKYCGFISLMISVIFIMAYHSLTLSCVVLVLSLTVGYSHWFPDIKKPSRARRESIVISMVLLIVIAVVEGFL